MKKIIVLSIVLLMMNVVFVKAQDSIATPETPEVPETPETPEKVKRRVFIFEESEIQALSEDVKKELRFAKREIAEALKELQEVEWKEVERELEIAMEEAERGLREAETELRRLEVEIEQDMQHMEEEVEHETENIRNSPRIRIRTDNMSSRPTREVVRNFSSLENEKNTTLSEKLKKDSSSEFEASIQNDVQITPQVTAGTFDLSFELPEKKSTYIEIYDSKENLIYYESLSDFKGKHKATIDLAVNGADTYILVVRQGDKFMSRKIVLN